MEIGVFAKTFVRPDLATALDAVVASCRGLGTSVITLCTGTRDPDDMWRWHPDNSTPEAWRDVRAALVILHGLAEDEVPAAVALLRERMAA